MRRTLFLIPHEIAGLPFFGVGWLLAGLVLYVVIRLVWAARQPDSPGNSGNSGNRLGSVLRSESAVWIFFALIVVIVLPRLELDNVAGEPVGLPIRGYGMFLMLAGIFSVSLAAWRAGRAGLGADSVLRLVPWTFGGGLLGARIFYVIQYFDDFLRPTWGETITAMAALTQGGLVVYGGFIGGFLASAYAISRHRMPLWKLGDVIVPCIFVGLFFGRLGCLMNGCCYGGACEPNALSAEFPPGSSVYVDQMLNGEIIGITATVPTDEPKTGDEQASDKNSNEGEESRGPARWLVQSVAAGSLAEKAGIRSGETVSMVLDPGYARLAPPDIPAEDALPGLAVIRDGDLVARISPTELPARAAPVWATQIISSLVAATMLFVLLMLERILRRSVRSPDGVLMLCGFIAYAVLRIILEWVRVDEAGQFGTALSISQWVSVVVILASVVALVVRVRSHRPTSIGDSQAT